MVNESNVLQANENNVWAVNGMGVEVELVDEGSAFQVNVSQVSGNIPVVFSQGNEID